MYQFVRRFLLSALVGRQHAPFPPYPLWGSGVGVAASVFLFYQKYAESIDGKKHCGKAAVLFSLPQGKVQRLHNVFFCTVIYNAQPHIFPAGDGKFGNTASIKFTAEPFFRAEA